MSKTLKFMTNSGKRKFRVAPKPKKETGIRTGYFISNTNQIIPQLYPQIITVMPSTPNIKIVQGSGPEARENVIDEQMETKIKFRSGIEIPEMAEPVEKKEISILISEESPDVKKVDMKYPLIPQKPRKGEPVFAYAHIFYDKRLNELIYNVIEPAINEIEKKVLADIKEYIQEKLNINFAQIRKKEAFGYITDIFNRALEYFKVNFEKSTEEKLKYYVFRDFVGLEMIEPFMKDRHIEDISCDGVNIPLYVYHRDPRFGSLKTNIIFKSTDELDLFVNKLSEKCGKSISVARPLLDGTLPEGSRVQATLGSDIARHGSNFTIRMFTEEPLTPTDIIEFGTCDPRMMAYFWILVEHGLSFLVSGSTATGKTSFLNVLSLFIKPQMKIVSVEDTSELRLSHSHWIPEVARTPISEAGKVDMFELLRSSLRQRPDYIIVGEVRGSEAYVLFQQMATGHPGLSTIHAENMSKLMDRLTTPPINLSPNLIQNLDIIIFLKRFKKGRKYIRRVSTVTEVIGYDRRNMTPMNNDIFVWDPKKDVFMTVNKSFMLRKIAESTDLNENGVAEEIKKRVNVIRWMVKNKIRDYKKVGTILNLFYTDQAFLLSRIGSRTEGSV